jgi:EmrB/QacA subfamily drug resistance transporter
MEGQPHAVRRWWMTLALLCMAKFMVILDSQIVFLALPSIERGLAMSVESAQWVLSAYLLSFGGLLLLGGRAADLLGRRRVFIVGTGLFLVSSLVCGLAWSGAALVSARVVQGMSAAVMAPTALSILTTTYEEGPQRNRALAVWSATGGLGATAALLIGGTLTVLVGWRAVFLLNVPVAAALIVASLVLLGKDRPAGRARAYDPAGAVTITGALVLLVWAIVEAPGAGWWSGQTIGALAGSTALVAAFVLIERRSAQPLVPLGMFRSSSLVGGNLVMLLYAFTAFGTSLAIAQYAQLVLGYSALRFGVATIAMTGMTVVGAAAAQRLMTRVGPAAVTVGGLVLMAAGSFLLSRVPVHADYAADIAPALLLFGTGLGGGTVGAAVAALAGVRERHAGVASATVSAAFQIGGALGVAIVSTVAAAQAAGSDPLIALANGYRAGFVACLAFAVAGVVLAVLLLGRARSNREDPAIAASRSPTRQDA